jgi:hypothetical protein
MSTAMSLVGNNKMKWQEQAGGRAPRGNEHDASMHEMANDMGLQYCGGRSQAQGMLKWNLVQDMVYQKSLKVSLENPSNIFFR